ncbi:MAG: glucose 1-dehydrogenase [Acidimicrobiia bacterium]|nr:glucose 1-dehydrogenase [Acidimicrobiia bacterium]
MRGLTDKVVIVTGGAGGIGAAVCGRFAEEGAHVAVVDINGEAASRAASAISSAGRRAVAFDCDITDHAAVQRLVAEVHAQLGAVDILVNNAGWDVFKPFVDTDPVDWQQLIAVNLIGPLNLHHVVLPGMVARGSGRVVNVASDAGRVGSSGEAVYAACKAGLLGLSKTLAREHARHNITINVVCPGPTDTPLFDQVRKGAANPEKLEAAFTRSIPMGRIGQPADLPGAICFFASDDAAYITGQVLSVSGGLTMSG